MVPLEYKGGFASGMTEILVIGLLALAIIVLGLLLMRSMKKIQVPYADGTPAHPTAGDDSSRNQSAADPGDRPERSADRPHDKRD